MRSFRGVALAWTVGAGVLLASVSADARTVYRWETEEGVISFADELRRVPERYRDQVKTIDTKKLSSAKRFSKMAEPATAGHAAQVATRLESLRALNGAAAHAGTSHGRASASVVNELALSGPRRDDGRTRMVDQVVPMLNLGAVAESEAPIVVDEIRVRSDEGSPNVTRRVTVIRQGERVLAVIKPAARRAYGLDFPDESELEADR